MNAPMTLLLLLATACTTGGGRPGAEVAPAGPVHWPPGHYLASAHISFTSGAVRAGSSPRRFVQAEVYVDAGGTITLTTGEGACQEQNTKRPDVRDFSCGDASFRLTLHEGAIRGTAVAPVTYWVSELKRCLHWTTDEQGRQTCDAWNDDTPELRTTRASADLSIVLVG